MSGFLSIYMWIFMFIYIYEYKFECRWFVNVLEYLCVYVWVCWCICFYVGIELCDYMWV